MSQNLGRRENDGRISGSLRVPRAYAVRVDFY